MGIHPEWVSAYEPRRLDRGQRARELLASVGVTVNGGRPWDMRIHHPATLDRVLAQGSLGPVSYTHLTLPTICSV